MFRLYDSTRRRVCRAGFLLLGVMQLLLTAGWCLWRHLPWQADWEGRRIAQLLGLSVRIGEVQFLRPGAVLYADVELTDPETGQAVLRCRSVEAIQPAIAKI